MSSKSHIEDLEQNILAILQRTPAGISEYELMESLGNNGVVGFEGRVCGDELTLFQSHFLLFHCLYRLRERLQRELIHGLEIHCLKIMLVPLKHEYKSNSLGQHDPLCAYYLDLSNLENTTQADVSDLLNTFWQRFLSADDQIKALQVLGLDMSASYDEIRVRYKRLVMENHPDRGGDTMTLQSINEAMDQLRTYHS